MSNLDDKFSLDLAMNNSTMIYLATDLRNLMYIYI